MLLLKVIELIWYKFNQTIYKKSVLSTPLTIGYVLGKFMTKVSSIEPNSGIDRYRRNLVSNQH